MEIRYNVTGAERKSFVAAVSGIVGCDAVYMKAPSFAYTVGEYIIDKNGTLVFDERVDREDVRSLLAGLADGGFVSEDSIDMGDPEAGASAGGVPVEDAFGQDVPAEVVSGGEVYVDTAPVADVPAVDVPDRDASGEDASAGEAPADDVPGRLVIEMSLEGFTATALDNLEKLAASKAALIMKAIGTDALPIERDADRLRFPWFSPDASPEEVGAYTQFVHALCEMAKKQKRVTAKEKPADSEKFAFRCFLLRLGFIGSEYAAARKILLANLPGDSSFKSGNRQDRAVSEAAPVAANAADNGVEIGGDGFCRRERTRRPQRGKSRRGASLCLSVSHPMKRSHGYARCIRLVAVWSWFAWTIPIPHSDPVIRAWFRSWTIRQPCLWPGTPVPISAPFGVRIRLSEYEEAIRA